MLKSEETDMKSIISVSFFIYTSNKVISPLSDFATSITR